MWLKPLPRNDGVVDCHESLRDSRNDAKSAHNTKSTLKDARLTHPQTPSAEGGGFCPPHTRSGKKHGYSKGEGF
ncbi:hypothetical protein [Helicobacter macacae]|uniref:hypothetical protein n=1 Tax=Helicobacter macacae TaxID=398626 RepID=UPI00041F6736|nr:hypothetical protein [Helicobacter macacae]